MFQIWPPYVALIIALLPAAAAWWWGRSLARRVDDPALPERVLATRSRTTLVLASSLAILFVTATPHLIWALPLLALSRMAAAYPLRRSLHQETWTLHAYMWFFLRLATAGFGFWVLLAVLPALAMAAADRDWIVSAVLAVFLILWNNRFSDVLRFVLRARRVDDPVIVPPFVRMAEQCRIGRLVLERVDLGGGVFANAVALPSNRQQAVVMTDTLATRLEPDEVVAILAHELAHFEYYNASRLRRLNFATLIQILAGACLPLVVRLWAPVAGTAVALAWPLVLLVVLVVRSQHRQQNETVSDLRAVDLTGNPEALVRALVKLHVLAHLPRRWAFDFERQATHPSLARRIQAIRGAAGTAPAHLSESVPFVSFDRLTTIEFEDQQLTWRNRKGSETIPYSGLRELRLSATPSGSARLVVVDLAGRRRDTALEDADVARAQAILDIVDVRLPKAPAPPVISSPMSRALAISVSLAATLLGQPAALLVILLAAAVPAPALLAAAGTAALTAGSVATRSEPLSLAVESHAWMALALVGLGALLGATAFFVGDDRRPSLTSKLVVLLGACAAGGWLLVFLWGGDVIGIHRGTREWPGAAVFTCALAASLFFNRRGAARYAALPVALAGLFASAAGSTTFLDRFGSDPFLARAPLLVVKLIDRAPTAEFTIPYDVTDLRLSPSLRFLAVLSEDRDGKATVFAGPWGGPLTEFEADEAVFVDEARLLLFERRGEESVLRLIALDAGNAEVWRRTVPVRFARFSVDEAARRWRLLGWDGETQVVMSASAGFDGSLPRDERWTSPGAFPDVQALSASRGVLLALEARAGAGLARSFPRWASAVRPDFRVESTLWSLGEARRERLTTSRLALSCDSVRLDDERTICTAYDGTRTHVFSVSPHDQPKPLTEFPGFLYLESESGGWVSGWWNGGPVILRPDNRQAFRLRERDESLFAFELAVAGDLIGALFSGDDQTVVRLYPLDDANRPDAR